MKWLLLSIALIALGVFTWVQTQSVKVSYVNGLPRYSSLPMQEYLFEEDCYIIRAKGSTAAWPLVANHRTLPSLPSPVTEANVGKTFEGNFILATVKLGSQFRLISVRREQGRDRTLISYEIVFLDETERPFPRLDARLLLIHNPADAEAPPAFDPTAVVPRQKI